MLVRSLRILFVGSGILSFPLMVCLKNLSFLQLVLRLNDCLNTVSSFCRYSNFSTLCRSLCCRRTISTCRRVSSLLAYTWTKKSACPSSRITSSFWPRRNSCTYLHYWARYLKTGPVLHKGNCPPSSPLNRLVAPGRRMTEHRPCSWRRKVF